MIILKPPPVPSPETGGGAITRMLPAVICAIAPNSSPATSVAPMRVPAGFSVMKIAPALGALVKVAPSKPAKAMVLTTFGFFSASACASSSVAVVRWSEAPGGICTTPIR